MSGKEIAAVGHVYIDYFKIPPQPPLIYEPQPDIIAEDSTILLGTMWKSSLLLQCPRPPWSGIMQQLHTGDYPGVIYKFSAEDT